jgi:capsular exopolysaccharide synthesis family protein
MFQLTNDNHPQHRSAARREPYPVELRTYWRMLAKNWWVVVAGALVGLLAGMGLSALMTPRYESTATLYVSVRGLGAGEVGDLFSGASFAQTVVTSYVDIATTAIVLDEVAEEMGDEVPRATMGELLSVQSPEGSSLLNVTAEHSNPETAAALVNATGEALVDVVENEIEVGAAGGSSPVQVRLIDPGTVPDESISPNAALNSVLGLLVGLAVGIGLAIVRGSLDTRIHSVADVEEITNIPVVGRIAHDDSIAHRPLVVHDDPRSPRAEAFRTTRTNLQFFATNDDARVFVVSSATPGEGKTHVVANLAVVLAESGARVALIEADLRRPRLANVMGIEGAVGLQDVLTNRASLEDVTQQWGTDHLSVIPAGQIPPNPSELLGSPMMREIVNELKQTADYVLIDAPPVLPVTDAAILSTYASGSLLVSSVGHTRQQNLEQAIESLENVGGKVWGLIVNKVPMRGSANSGFITYKYAEKPENAKSKSRVA